MKDLNQDEEIKIAVGVWICFADKVVQPIETAAIYQVMKKDLLPESHGAAMEAVGHWLKAFNQNHLDAEQKLESMIKSYERLPIIKKKVLELAEHVSHSDGKKHLAEESALEKLKVWLGA